MLAIDSLPRAVTNGNIGDIAHSELGALEAKCVEVGTVGENGSGWIIKRFVNIFINVYETSPIRAASYIPTPPKYNNAKCGLINIQNDDQECVRWCLKYHQSAKDKNASRITVLKKGRG